MACDIHVHFEILTESGWQYGPWPLLPNPNYWWISIIHEDLESKKALMAFGISEKKHKKRAYDVLENFYKQVPLDQVEQKFGHRNICRSPEWQTLPLSLAAADAREKQLPEPNWHRAEICYRDYRWFNRIAGVRGLKKHVIWHPRNTPNDVSMETKTEIAKYENVGHSHSWLMVNEILDEPKLKRFVQRRWLQKFVPEPHRTRMIFWFDN